jgi:hypothetical protein
MAFSRVFPRRAVSGIRLVLVTALGLLVLLPTGAMGAARGSSTHAETSASPAAGSFAANVTWNGVNVNTAGSASSALSIDFSKSADVKFNWTATPLPVGVIGPNDARLQMIYFGFALSTRDVINTGTQPVTRLDMNWTPGAIVYVLEGVYEIKASLLTPNGSTLWSENFFVKASAPFSILAALPIILIVLVVWELYSVARSGRQVMLAQKGKPPPSPPEEPTPSEPTTPPTGEPAPGGPEEPT